MKKHSTKQKYAIIAAVVAGAVIVTVAASLPGKKFQAFLPSNNTNPPPVQSNFAVNCTGFRDNPTNGNPDFSETVNWNVNMINPSGGTLQYPVSSYKITWHGNRVEGKHEKSFTINYPYQETLSPITAGVMVTDPSGKSMSGNCTAVLAHGDLDLQLIKSTPINGTLDVSCSGQPGPDSGDGKEIIWTAKISNYTMNGASLSPSGVTDFYWYGSGLPATVSPANITVVYPQNDTRNEHVMVKAVANFGTAKKDAGFASADCQLDLSKISGIKPLNKIQIPVAGLN